MADKWRRWMGSVCVDVRRGERWWGCVSTGVREMGKGLCVYVILGFRNSSFIYIYIFKYFLVSSRRTDQFVGLVRFSPEPNTNQLLSQFLNRSIFAFYNWIEPRNFDLDRFNLTKSEPFAHPLITNYYVSNLKRRKNLLPQVPKTLELLS